MVLEPGPSHPCEESYDHLKLINNPFSGPNGVPILTRCCMYGEFGEENYGPVKFELKSSSEKPQYLFTLCFKNNVAEKCSDRLRYF